MLGARLAPFALVAFVAVDLHATEVPTDRLIVRLKGGAPVTTKSATDRASIAARLTIRTGELMVPLRVMGDGSQVMQLFRRLPAAEISRLAKDFESDHEILEVLPDRIFFPALTPTDPLYTSQWALTAAPGINAPAAWDITTGATNLIIAIVDTGKLPHDDLAGRWIGGYDFVSLLERANDGDLRDPDPSDPGDWVTPAESASGPLSNCPVTDSRWHGTAMAGIIAANANNGTGIAGINWNSKLLPVRVVGKCGGYESDIADGIRWAVGISVPGTPANPNTADLLNVSLSSAGSCTSVLQSAINEVIASGAPIIVAAGNNSLAASGYSPGNCAGVITVGALDKNGGKPNYANFGDPIALSAPGGIGSAIADAVLTTQNEGTTAPSNNNFYSASNGTSIAAAHVSGVVSLVLSVKPTLSPQFVKEILQNTSRAFPAGTTALGSQADCSIALCGRGMTNSAQAVDAAQRWGVAAPQVTGGGFIGMGLRSDGTVWTWGTDTSAQGRGGASGPTPGQVTLLAGATRISAGWFYALALRSDASVWSWGNNDFGQLGNGTTGYPGSGGLNSSAIPVQVMVSGAVAIAAGGYHALALKGDGTVWSWGRNSEGELGDGGNTNRLVPVQVSGLTGVTAIAASTSSHSVALKSDGTVWTWGHNNEGELGDGTQTNRATPVAVSGLSAVSAIAAGGGQTLALKSDGTVWAWGYNLYGQLGDGTTSDRATPAPVSGLTGVVAIAAGLHSLALKSDGTVWAWGLNDRGQLGDGTLTERHAPVQVQGLTSVIAIGAAYRMSYAIKTDGSVWAWGEGTYGQLGNGTTPTSQSLPVRVSGANGAPYLDLNEIDPASAFAAQVDVPLGSVRTSNAATFVGIAPGSAMNVAGGEYSLNGAAFITAPGTLNPGDAVALRHTASPNYGVTTTTTLTVAGIGYPFNVTTLPGDTLPDAFAFNVQWNVPLGTVITSNVITVTGINVPAPISVANGEYSIGCGASFTSTAGFITNGQTVCVRQTASALSNTLTSATLTVGAFSAAFKVITPVGASFSVSPRVAGVGGFTLGVRTDGTLWTWGSDANALGRGGASGPIPAQVTQLAGVTQIAAGWVNGFALRSDGSVWAWGSNDFGQLGNGTTGYPGSGGLNSSAIPVQVMVSGAVAIAAGGYHALALTGDGTVWSWGFNDHGQLGDGSNTNRMVPVQVSGLTGVIAIAASTGSHSVALKSDGTVWAWGDNTVGELGEGWTSNRATPVQVLGLSGVTAIAAGGGHTLALKSDGSVWAWGYNAYGQLGDGTIANRASAAPVPGLTGVIAIACGLHTMALKSDGTVWTLGLNTRGQLGDGTLTERHAPVQVQGLANVIAIAASYTGSFAIKTDGSVWAWGEGTYGQLGNGTTPTSQSLPVRVSGALGDGYLSLILNNTIPEPFFFSPLNYVGVNEIVTSNPIRITGIVGPTPLAVAGGEYSLNGAAFTSAPGPASNNDTVVVRVIAAPSVETFTSVTLSAGGAQGVGSTFYVRTRSDPSLARIPPRVAAGDSHTLMLFPDGTVAATGYNGNGQLGNGTSLGLSQLLPVAGMGGIVSIVSGSFHSLALRNDGTVVSWGSNAGGQLGSNSNRTSEPYPVNVVNLSSVISISAGGYHSVAVKNDGTVWAWGLNAEGQVGDGSSVSTRSSPGQVPGLVAMSAVAAGGRHTLALRADGTVMAWGANEAGQLGDGTTTQRRSPVAVPGLAGVIAIAAGDAHSLAIKSDGTVVAWGFNAFGQLGDGTTMNRLVPIAVTSLGTGVGLIAAGANHSLAVKAGGGMYSWGNNANSQLGNGNNANSSVPVLLAAPSAVVAISGGARHTAVIDSSRKLFVWGDNFFGQVGNRSGNYSPHSASLNVLRGDSVISTGVSGASAGVGTASNSGSSVLEIDGQARGFDFGTITSGAFASIAGKYKNQSATEDISAISLGVAGSSFSLSSSTCPATLIPNAECSFTIAFSPVSPTAYSGELVITSNVVGSPERRSLNGAGLAPAVPAIAFARNGLDFPPQTVGSATAPASYTLSNSGNAALTVNSITSTLADYSASHNCVGVAPGATCTVSVTFVPAAANQRTAFLSVDSNAAGSPHSITVSGAGVATTSPASYALTVGKTGAGIGTITSAPGGVDCGAVCTGHFAPGTVVTLNANPAAGVTFGGWSGGGCAGTGSCVVTLNTNTSLSAVFNVANAITSASATTFTVTQAGTFALNVSSNPPPSVSVSGTLPAGVSFNPSTKVLSGTPALGTVGTYSLTFTASNGVAPDATQTFTLTIAKADQIITFAALPNKTLGDPPITVSATGGGSGNPVTFTSSTPSVCVVSGPNGTTVSLQAQGTCTITANQLGNANYNAANPASQTFQVGAPGTFALTITKSGTGSGTVTSNPAGIDCGSTCSVNLTSGSTMTLTATAANGSVFSGWSGGGCLGKGTCVVTLNASTSVSAAFNAANAITSASAAAFTVTQAGTFTVTVTGNPAPSVSVSGTLPAGVNFNASTKVLSGAPALGTVGTHSLTFTASNGVAPDATQTFTLTIAKADQIIPFAALPNKTLGDPPVTVSATGGGSGNPVTFTSSTPSVCVVSGPNGTTVSLQAQGTCILTANQLGNANYNAASPASQTFQVGAPGTFALTITKSGTGSGTVTSIPAGIDCGATCSVNLTSGSTMTLTATAANGSTFGGWSGGCAGIGTCQVTMDAVKGVTATFSALSADVALAQVINPNFGTVGQDVVFTLTATNNGPDTATGVSVTDTLPAGMTFMSASSGCTNSSGTVTCSVGSLATGASIQVNVVARPTSAGTITNNASVIAVEADPSTANNSSSAVLTVNAPPAGTLSNISTRMQVLTGNDVMIGGFVIGGSASKTVVVRARGPSLVPYGITNALANPTLQLVRSSDQVTIATNDDWQSAGNAAAITASGFAPSNALESAILATLPPGAYTAIVSGVGGSTGVGIVEVFEVDHPEVLLTNISTRGQVLTGNDVMIGGFIIQGSAPQTVMVRARGPSLIPYGITNALADPVLQLFSGQTLVASNDDWGSATNAVQIQASGFAPGNARESAILITLNPGAYTAIVTGAGGGTGVGIVEVFAQ